MGNVLTRGMITYKGIEIPPGKRTVASAADQSGISVKVWLVIAAVDGGSRYRRQ